MTEHKELEQRLGRGLKRWAEAGEATLDLEAYVLAQAGEATPDLEANRPAQAGRKRRPAWMRWATASAAAAILLLSLGITFPQWAGATAGWPLVGPVVTEIIMKDAGLKWAYDHDLLHGAVAEARDGEVGVRILGVMADSVRTTVIYQITGVSDPLAQERARPIQADGDLRSRFARPANTWPEVRIRELPGQSGHYVSQDAPVWTPLGLVGTFSTSPLGVDAGTMKLDVKVEGHEIALSFPVSRAETDKFARMVAVGQTHTANGISVTVDSLILTPVETVVRYRVEKREFGGSFSYSNHEYSPYLDSDGRREYGRNSFNDEGLIVTAFPAHQGPAKFGFLAQVAGEPVSLTWPLEKGAAQDAAGAAITLEDWSFTGQTLYVAWKYPAGGRLVSFTDLEVVDAAGKAHKAESKMGTWSDVQGMVNKAEELRLPEGVTPVAVRAKQIGVSVQGPWEITLPER